MMTEREQGPERHDEDHVITLEEFGTLEDPDEKPPSEVEAHDMPAENERRPASRMKLYLMVLADFGLSFTWLCKFAVATPYFQHSLKAGTFLSHLVWIMGPLSGLVVAPVVGVLSDRCTSSFGRRRPFILGGAIFCIIGMMVFANATRLSFGFLPAARAIAFLAFGVLDFATNAIMFPSRALLGDLLPAEQQHPVQSAAAVVASVAEICAGAYIALWKDPVTNISTIFSVASVLLAISCSVSLYVCKETPITIDDLSGERDAELVVMNGNRTAPTSVVPDEGSDTAVNAEEGDRQETEPSHESIEGRVSPEGVADHRNASVHEEERTGRDEENDEHRDDEEAVLSMQGTRFSDVMAPAGDDGYREPESAWGTLAKTIREAISNFPRPLVKVGIVYGLAWFVWFASLPYYSQWLGVDVLKGDPEAAAGTEAAILYERGVGVFSAANVAKALLAIVFSAFYPSIIKWVGAIGERVVFGLSFLLFSSVLFAFAYTDNVGVAAGVIALGSVPFIVTQTIPIAMVVQRYPEQLASNLGVLNLFCVVPQLIDTLYVGKVAEVASESAVLRVAAGWGFAAAIAAFCLL